MNQVINFFWTIVCFIPIGICWGIADSFTPCYIFLGLSFMCMFIPLRFLRLSNNPDFYAATGIKFVRKFVQNGDYINRAIRKSKPEYRTIKNKENAVIYLKTTVVSEIYHLFCLVFFTLTIIYTIVLGHYLMAAITTLANVLYNIYPILLQQYNRARIMKMTAANNKQP